MCLLDNVDANVYIFKNLVKYREVWIVTKLSIIWGRERERVEVTREKSSIESKGQNMLQEINQSQNYT